MPTKKKTSLTKKTAAKKTAAKKTAAKKAAKKPVAKKAAKKTVAKKVAKKPVVKKAAKKTVAKKAAKKTVAKKAAKKTVAKKGAKTVAKKAAKKTVAKKAAKKTVAKKAAKKTVAKKAAKKTVATPVAKKVAKKTVAKKVAKKSDAKKAAKKPVAKKVAKKSDAQKGSLATALIAAPGALDAYGAIALPSSKSAAPLPTKAQEKSKTRAVDSHGAVALPGKKKALDVGSYAPSKRAAVTVVAAEDIDDALDDAMGDAFDAVFQNPPAAKAKRAKSTAPFVPGDPQLDLAQVCAALALDKKADNVVILQVAELTSYADYFVIAAASSERQAQSVARTIADELRRHGKQPLSTDGLEQGNWVIIDYGAVVVHVFMESARAYYDLDGFWVDAPRVEVDEGRGQAALDHMG